MLAKCGASRFLNMQKHHDITSIDIELKVLIVLDGVKIGKININLFRRGWRGCKLEENIYYNLPTYLLIGLIIS